MTWEQTISEAWDNVEQSTDAIPCDGEKDKPTDGDDDDKDKDDPEGGGGGGNSNNEDNNDQKEPPEGGDENTDNESDFDMDKLTRSQGCIYRSFKRTTIVRRFSAKSKFGY